MNNPVNRFDVNGNWSLPNWAKVTVGVVAIGIGAAATVATGGAALHIIASVALTTGVGAIGGYITGGKQGAIDEAANVLCLEE